MNEYQRGANKYCTVCEQIVAADFTHCPRDGSALLNESMMTPRDFIGELAEQYDIEDRWDTHNAITFQLREKDKKGRVLAKILRRLPNEERERERFERMSANLSKLNHPNIPKVLNKGVINDDRAFVMLEYKDGQTLASMISENGKLKINETCKIFAAVCDALQHAHENDIYHPDLTAEDIIIKAKKGSKKAWDVALIDFGKGKPLFHGDNRDQQFTELGDLFGFAQVMAPETCQNGTEPDALSNIYSLGCVLFMALSGNYPFNAKNWIAILHQHATAPVPPLYESGKSQKEQDIEGVVHRALSKDRSERYGSAQLLKDALVSISTAKYK